MIRRFFEKIRGKVKSVGLQSLNVKKLVKEKVEISKSHKEYPNRFMKFYHLNKERIISERHQTYAQKKKEGICVRCNRPVVFGIIFCEYHQLKQKGYNVKARR